MSGTRTIVDNTFWPGRACWMKNIGSLGEIALRGKWAALGGNYQKGQCVSFGGGLGILENRYGMVRSNGKFGHGINFSNHRRLRRKFR